MVSHQGGSASNIEVFLGNGSQALMPGTALVPSWLGHANVREPAMVPYQGGSASNIAQCARGGGVRKSYFFKTTFAFFWFV